MPRIKNPPSTETAVKARKPSIVARQAAPGLLHPREEFWSSRQVGGGSDWMAEWLSKPVRR